MKLTNGVVAGGRDWCREVWGRFVRLQSRWSARRERQLHLRENLALGEKRFLSVVEYGAQRFLVGSNAHSVAVLTELPGDSTPAKGGEDVPTYKFVEGELTRDQHCG